VDDAVARGAAAAGETSSATRLAEAKLAAADDVVRTVQGIAQQSRMLAINASVEATRAGEQGRAFGVLAREMLTLADEARSTSSTITATLGEIRGALSGLQLASQGSADATREQLKTLNDLLGLVAGLQATIESLASAFASDAAGGSAR
jgi:methyl-accepting chemotaxis protein